MGSKYWTATEKESGIAWLDEKIKKDIKKTKEKFNIVIVSMHFGNEYEKQPSAEQKRFSYLAVDSGADLVIGHHPHVVQPIEQYKNGYIAYSLGNFIFDQAFSKETMEGLLLKMIVKNKKIIEIIPKNIKIDKFFRPEIIN